MTIDESAIVDGRLRLEDPRFQPRFVNSRPVHSQPKINCRPRMKDSTMPPQTNEHLGRDSAATSIMESDPWTNRRGTIG